MLRRAAAFLIVCVAIAALLYGAAFAWAMFTSRPFTIGALPPLPFPSVAPPGIVAGSPPPLSGDQAPGGTTPAAATQPAAPQQSSRPCPAFALTAFKLTAKPNRQETAAWTTSGGCAPFAGVLSWSGQGVQSGQVPIGTASGTTTVTVSAPPCAPNSTASATVTFRLVLGDGGGHRVQTAVVAVVSLC